MNREEEKWLRLYNQYCGKFLQKERCRRGIPVYRIARGICSATTLERIEQGEISWRKMDGDVLLQRLGVPTEYFEVMTQQEELERWRKREDICMAILEQPQKARHMLDAYQRQYRILPPIEKQFVKKMQTILLMQGLKTARETIKRKECLKVPGRVFFAHCQRTGSKRNCQNFFWLRQSWKVFCFWRSAFSLQMKEMRRICCIKKYGAI